MTFLPSGALLVACGIVAYCNGISMFMGAGAAALAV
jgi:hypothetical protein